MELPKEIDGYKVVEQLGAGSSSVVYRVSDSENNQYALKLFHQGLNLSGSLKKNFVAEAKTLEKIASNRIARFHKLGEYQGTFYLLIDLVEGKALDRLIEDGPLSGLQLQSAINGLIEALRDTHASGVTHRDLKPANIMLGPDGLKVIDFGLSTLEDANASTRSVISGGTPAWLSPEQAIGKSVGPESDIFSLGLVIAFMATGKNPFGQGKPDALIYRIVNEEPDLSDLPEALRAIVERCLAKEPADRPQIDEIADFVLALESGGLDAGQTHVASKTTIASFGNMASKASAAKTPTQNAPGKPRRRGFWAAIISAGALVVLVILAFLPSKGDLVLNYVSAVNTNRLIFDSALEIQYPDATSQLVGLPIGSVETNNKAFSEDLGQWQGGERYSLQIISEVDEMTTKTTSFEIPRSFSIFNAGRTYFVTVYVTDERFELYGTWSEIEPSTQEEGNLIAFALRQNEQDWKQQRVAALSLCKVEEEDRIEKLVGGATGFWGFFVQREQAMYQGMPATLSHYSYRTRLYNLSDELFSELLATPSPELNGNAAKLSNETVVATRAVYSAMNDLIDTTQWLGDFINNNQRYNGNYWDMYSREFAVLEMSDQVLASAIQNLSTSISDDALYICEPQFPELK